ncbi:fluoride efflux transporter CrcB [Desulfovibrio litoralis]|uniref:Fluoride-specific ion channel FluC n=1 Tax=Desulfovibrio litoralis DSM 11393 TaxID=1121455 RepID=A0A1M7T972_9BACT|nr:fluoride efflux transporter CrcB [Desulfovibrio litoralis]SHN67243.1 camphor resistance protein CrcB [Desulfovibrio litoralis DSM 11393]
MLKSLLAISLGASLGASLRWLLSLWLNGFLMYIPLGTLSANLIGGYLIGIFFGVFSTFSELSPELRLFIITGFLGALTTFSAFSLETSLLLKDARMFWALCTIALNVCGSLLMTFLGFGTYNLLKNFYS